VRSVDARTVDLLSPKNSHGGASISSGHLDTRRSGVFFQQDPYATWSTANRLGLRSMGRKNRAATPLPLLFPLTPVLYSVYFFALVVLFILARRYISDLIV